MNAIVFVSTSIVEVLPRSIALIVATVEETEVYWCWRNLPAWEIATAVGDASFCDFLARVQIVETDCKGREMELHNIVREIEV